MSAPDRDAAGRPVSALELQPELAAALWRRVGELVEAHRAQPGAVVPRGELPAVDLAPRDVAAAVEEVVRALEAGIVPTDHPRYFGLFNAAPAALAVIADALVSAFNPQLATRGHAPWPVAVEERLIAELGARFGYAQAEGAFTTGGGEANLTALTCALGATFPEHRSRGVRGLPAEPRVYVSTEGHATVMRAARLSGLGDDAVRRVSSDANQRMKPGSLREAIANDRLAGVRPLLVVATAGTTSSGAIDPLPELAAIAEREGCWLHVDAAWGGLAALVPELRVVLDGIARADSITFDAHKVMSAPIGTGTFLTRRAGVLEQVFAEGTGYMPRDGASDPYARAIPWSRRFAGLRLYLPLVAIGWEGYAASLRQQVMLADRLREGLRRRRWRIVNDTPLPVVCFVDEAPPSNRFLETVARHVIATDGGWISVPRFASGARALRACVNNHRTAEVDIDRLLDALDEARLRAR